MIADLLLRTLAWICSLWSDHTNLKIARALGALWFHVLRYRRSVIEENLSRAFPELDPSSRAGLCKAACTHLVLSLLELLRLQRHGPRLRARMRVEHLERWQEAHDRGRGVLCVTGHLGSFELAAGAIASRLPGHKIWLLVKDFPSGVDRFLTRTREAAGLGVMRARGSLPQILRALKRGETVVFVLDQNATRKLGVFVDFFGTPACTMSALALVALRTGAPVLGASIWRDGVEHVLEVSPELEVDATADRERAIVLATQRYTQFIEAQIRRHPEQWLWTHKRWRTRPLEQLSTETSSAVAARSESPP